MNIFRKKREDGFFFLLPLLGYAAVAAGLTLAGLAAITYQGIQYGHKEGQALQQGSNSEKTPTEDINQLHDQAVGHFQNTINEGIKTNPLAAIF